MSLIQLLVGHDLNHLRSSIKLNCFRMLVIVGSLLLFLFLKTDILLVQFRTFYQQILAQLSGARNCSDGRMGTYTAFAVEHWHLVTA